MLMTSPREGLTASDFLDDDDLTEVERWAFKGLKAARDSIYDSRTDGRPVLER
jgi:hypothetical protein